MRNPQKRRIFVPLSSAASLLHEMTTNICLKSRGFKPGPQNEIGFSVTYERETGLMYSTQFNGADELVEYNDSDNKI